MNRREKRKAITNIAKKAIQTGEAHVPMGMADMVAKRIQVLQYGSNYSRKPIEGVVTETADVTAIKKRVKRKLPFLRVWKWIRKFF